MRHTRRHTRGVPRGSRNGALSSASCRLNSVSPPPPILTEGARMSDVTLPTTGESAGPSAAKRAGRAAAYVFWIMFLINFLNYFDRFIFLGLEKSIQDTLHLSDFELGTAVGVFLLVYTLVALPLGFMADRIPRKTRLSVSSPPPTRPTPPPPSPPPPP